LSTQYWFKIQLLNLKKVKEVNLTSEKYIFNKKHIIYSKIRRNLNKVAIPNIKELCSTEAQSILVNKGHTIQTDIS